MNNIYVCKQLGVNGVKGQLQMATGLESAGQSSKRAKFSNKGLSGYLVYKYSQYWIIESTFLAIMFFLGVATAEIKGRCHA